MTNARKTPDSEFPRWCPGCSRQVDELCHHFNCALKRSDEIDRLRNALKKIAAIENQESGMDWEEIEEARHIARAALQGDQQ